MLISSKYIFEQYNKDNNYVYHGTAHALVPFIAHGGLDPETSSDKMTWFHKNHDEAHRYSEDHNHQYSGPKRKGAVLRVNTKHLPDDASSHLSYSDVTATSSHIPSHHIEHKQEDGSWKNLGNKLKEENSLEFTQDNPGGNWLKNKQEDTHPLHPKNIIKGI